MVMEYLRGRPLLELMFESGPLPAERALSIAIQIARALRRAHAQGVVHRDLKPSNVLILRDEEERDFAKVLDFGLVKVFAPDESDVKTPFGEDRLTRAGTMVGTPEYVSPEQALGDAVDDRADIYSLGVILYQMIAGRLPFHGESIIDVITQHLRADVPRIFDVSGVLCPPDIESVIRRSLRKMPDERQASMQELLVELKRAWRNLTDESYGTDTITPDLFLAIGGAREVSSIGLAGAGAVHAIEASRVEAAKGVTTKASIRAAKEGDAGELAAPNPIAATAAVASRNAVTPDGRRRRVRSRARIVILAACAALLVVLAWGALFQGSSPVPARHVVSGGPVRREAPPNARRRVRAAGDSGGAARERADTPARGPGTKEYKDNPY